jgi:hypothetical protein
VDAGKVIFGCLIDVDGGHHLIVPTVSPRHVLTTHLFTR